MSVLLCIDAHNHGHSLLVSSSSVLFVSNHPSHSIQVSLRDVTFSVVISLSPSLSPPSLLLAHNIGRFCTVFDLGGSSELLSFQRCTVFKRNYFFLCEFGLFLLWTQGSWWMGAGPTGRVSLPT